MDIQFKKLENMYGLSVIQMIMGILLSTYGVLIYVQVPQALINNNMSVAFTYLMLMYLTCSMASCLLVKYFIPAIQFVLLEIYFYFRRFVCCNRRPLLHRPLLYKNIDIHKERNQKIGLTFIVVVAFMMQIRTLSHSIANLAAISIQRIAGGDLAVISFDMKNLGKSSRAKAAMNGATRLSTLNEEGLGDLLNQYKQ